MAKVYLLFDGDYDNRRIIGAFSSRDAMEAVRPPTFVGATVEEHELDALAPGFGFVYSVDVCLVTEAIVASHTAFGVRPPGVTIKTATVYQGDKCIPTFRVESPVSEERAVTTAISKRREYQKNPGFVNDNGRIVHWDHGQRTWTTTASVVL